jgi:riboflavin kinase/FMN adenylyltransferase
MGIIDCCTEKPIPELTKNSAVTIGNFDGCHKGHQKLVDLTLELQDKLGLDSVALTFFPHPDGFFSPSPLNRPLFSPTQKQRAFCEMGLRYVETKTFNQSFSELSPETFYNDILRGELKAKAIVIGDNFRFGHRRLGSAQWLKAQGSLDQLDIVVASGEMEGGLPISSTRIRQALTEQGNAKAAAEWLGRPYLLEGVIHRGDQLGRTLGFPTANLGGIEQLIPKPGVYVGKVWLGSEDQNRFPPILSTSTDSYPAVINIGMRPTVSSSSSLRCEAHIINQSFPLDSLYERTAGIYLMDRLRDEEKFENIEALKSQIARDIDHAKQYAAF